METKNSEPNPGGVFDRLIARANRKFLRSVEGRQLPALGEVAVYWPTQDLTNIFSTEGFEFIEGPDGDEYPELIEHNAEATAKALLGALQLLLIVVDAPDDTPEIVRANAAVAMATGSN